ncbi:MAG: DUF2236 domain-containing protein [Elioraea sp.]|nr:DUF2236 domain-containing protein [Elioraea sp.]
MQSAFPLPLPFDPVRPLKDAIAGRVVAFFNDRARGEAPVVPKADGLFGPHSVTWRVHADVTGMMVGGITSLFLQMLHPRVLAGVWDHSSFRADLHGRLRRTARFIAVTTYGGREEAEAAIARVRRIHDRVRGTLPDGTPYAANDPWLLAWVHVTETWCFLEGFRAYAEPRLSRADQDRYFAEMARIGTALGADPVPRARREAEALMARFRPELRVDGRTRYVRDLLLRAASEDPLTAAVQAMGNRAAIALLPAWVRRMHGLASPTVLRPLVQGATFGVASAIRWAFADRRRAGSR